jgi:hypothetical protein
MNEGWRIARIKEWLLIKIAKRLPKEIRYWVVMLEIGKATIDEQDVMATSCDKILENVSKNLKKGWDWDK